MKAKEIYDILRAGGLSRAGALGMLGNMAAESGLKENIAHQGVQWSRNDVDGPSTVRTMSGLMVRDRVATKIRLDITCRPLKNDELRTLLNLILPVFVTVTYDDPMQGVVTKTMYANNNKAQFLQKFVDEGDDPFERWFNVTFPLVER